MADLFWTVATSHVALSGLAVLLLAGLVVGFAPLLRWVPGLAPYVLLARLVAFLTLAALAFLIGFRAADERAEVKQLKADLAFSRLQLDAQRQTADTAARLRAAAEADAATANQKVSDYEQRLSTLPADCGCALDDGDVGSLRDIAR